MCSLQAASTGGISGSSPAEQWRPWLSSSDEQQLPPLRRSTSFLISVFPSDDCEQPWSQELAALNESKAPGRIGDRPRAVDVCQILDSRKPVLSFQARVPHSIITACADTWKLFPGKKTEEEDILKTIPGIGKSQGGPVMLAFYNRFFFCCGQNIPLRRCNLPLLACADS
nr:BTB/POZ domain-containing protein At3g05675 isoform X1 [Ipomoea batatas]